MITYHESRQRLDVSPAELRTLVQLASDTGATRPVPDGWAEAGVVADGAVHPVVAAIAQVAVAPHRAVAIERLVGGTVAPLMVGWHRSGRATMTEHLPEPVAEGRLSISATHFELLPSLLLQAIGLQPDQPSPSRDTVVTTAGVVDDAVVDLAGGGVFGSLAASDDLLAILRHGRMVVRATGSWSGAPADTSVTLVLAGTEGIWSVERDEPDAGRETEVRLVPIDVATALVRLGDVVTGRLAASPIVA